MSFVKDVVGSSGAEATWNWLIAVSWVALGFSIFTAVFGLATLVNNLDEKDTKVDSDGVPQAFAAGKRGVVLRWVIPSISLFGLGMVALAVFGALNYKLFLNRKESTQQTGETKQNTKSDHFAIVSSSEHRFASELAAGAIR